MGKRRKLQIRTSCELNRLSETNLSNAYEKLVPPIKYAVKTSEKQCETAIEVLSQKLKMEGYSK